jgi:hypothetical protein
MMQRKGGARGEKLGCEGKKNPSRDSRRGKSELPEAKTKQQEENE